jgi:hypothetical protein
MKAALQQHWNQEPCAPFSWGRPDPIGSTMQPLLLSLNKVGVLCRNCVGSSSGSSSCGDLASQPCHDSYCTACLFVVSVGCGCCVCLL